MMITDSTTSKSSDASSTLIPQPTTKPIPTPITSTPAACNKMVQYDDKTGIIPDRYVLILKKGTYQSDVIELFNQIKNLMSTEGDDSIKVKEVILVENMKMITVQVNQAGLEWVSYTQKVYFVKYDS